MIVNSIKEVFLVSTESIWIIKIENEGFKRYNHMPECTAIFKEKKCLFFHYI